MTSSGGFTEADHERARRAGQQAMAKQAGQPTREHKPHPGWRFLFGWLALVEFAAFVIAIVQMFHSVTWEPGDGPMGITGRLMLWPLLISPHWLAALAAFAAFWVTALTWGALRRQPSAQPAAGVSARAAAGTKNDHSARLRKLQELWEAGLLSQEEYETKRSQIIDSI